MKTPTDCVGKRCFLCDEASDQIVWRESGLEGRLCKCGMVYTAGDPSHFPDDLAHEFHSDAFYARPAKMKARWVHSHSPRGRLLEVGSGNPFFLQEAKALGYEVEGLEPEALRARQVAHTLQVPVHEGFIEETELPKGSFDVVYHCDLLVHFPDPLLALSKMVELLAPGGVLAFEVGLLGGISPTWYRLIGELGLGQHLWLYSDEALRELLDRAQLTLRHEQHFGLAAQVLSSRPIDIACRRILAPVLRATRISASAVEAEHRAQNTTQSVDHFLRYGVGRFAPRLGPATLLMVLEPRR